MQVPLFEKNRFKEYLSVHLESLSPSDVPRNIQIEKKGVFKNKYSVNLSYRLNENPLSLILEKGETFSLKRSGSTGRIYSATFDINNSNELVTKISSLFKEGDKKRYLNNVRMFLDILDASMPQKELA